MERFLVGSGSVTALLYVMLTLSVFQEIIFEKLLSDQMISKKMMPFGRMEKMEALEVEALHQPAWEIWDLLVVTLPSKWTNSNTNF